MRDEVVYSGSKDYVQTFIERELEGMEANKDKYFHVEVGKFVEYIDKDGNKTGNGEVKITFDTPILNLTGHEATEEQKADGVVEPSVEDKKRIRELLTFQRIPTSAELNDRAYELAIIADKYQYIYAMIDGAPYMMPALYEALMRNVIHPVFSFSETHHIGWVKA